MQSGAGPYKFALIKMFAVEANSHIPIARTGGSAKVAKVLAFASFWHSVETTCVGLYIILAFC